MEINFGFQIESVAGVATEEFKKGLSDKPDEEMKEEWKD
jgi:hypothetical protein